MRLIDVDKITNEDIIFYLGYPYISCLSDIRDMLNDQPTVNPQCIANVKVDFSKEDIERMVEQQVKESVSINVDNLKDILMEYFDIGNDSYVYNLTRGKNAFTYGTINLDDFKEFDEDMIDDIIRFIKEKLNNSIDSLFREE